MVSFLVLFFFQGDKAAHQWTSLRLPENLVIKEKAKTHPRSAEGSVIPKHTLVLEAYVVCATDISKQVTACFGCIQREVSPPSLKNVKEWSTFDDVFIDIFSLRERGSKGRRTRSAPRRLQGWPPSPSRRKRTRMALE